MSALICLLINGSVSLHTHPFVFNEARLSLFTGSRFSTSLDKSSFVYKKRMNAFGRTVFGFLIEIHIENRPKYGIGLVYLILPLSHYRSVISWLNQLSFWIQPHINSVQVSSMRFFRLLQFNALTWPLSILNVFECVLKWTKTKKKTIAS